MEPTPATLTLGEAVRRVSVSRSTLQRRLKAGKIEGATHNEAGEWAIPFNSLIAAGLSPRVTPADPKPDPEAEVERVAAELASTKAELALVNRLAAERLESLTEARHRLRELEAARPTTDPADPFIVEGVTVEPKAVTDQDFTAAPDQLQAIAEAVAKIMQPTPRRRWWKRSG
jgi:hypothetical protein